MAAALHKLLLESLPETPKMLSTDKGAELTQQSDDNLGHLGIAKRDVKAKPALDKSRRTKLGKCATWRGPTGTSGRMCGNRRASATSNATYHASAQEVGLGSPDEHRGARRGQRGQRRDPSPQPTSQGHACNAKTQGIPWARPATIKRNELRPSCGGA